MNTLHLNVIFKLAWRNLWRNHRRTSIMLAAITVGVWAMIFMTALMRGMVDDMLLHGIRSMPGEVQIHHPQYRDDPSINNSIPAPGEALIEALRTPEVIAWTSRVKVPAVISSERDSRGMVLLGIEPEVDMTPHGGLDGGVSRRHAKFIYEGQAWFVVDLDSTNGTSVNGNVLAPKTRTALNEGDKIEFGEVEVVFYAG